MLRDRDAEERLPQAPDEPPPLIKTAAKALGDLDEQLKSWGERGTRADLGTWVQWRSREAATALEAIGHAGDAGRIAVRLDALQAAASERAARVRLASFRRVVSEIAKRLGRWPDEPQPHVEDREWCGLPIASNIAAERIGYPPGKPRGKALLAQIKRVHDRGERSDPFWLLRPDGPARVKGKMREDAVEAVTEALKAGVEIAHEEVKEAMQAVRAERRRRGEVPDTAQAVAIGRRLRDRGTEGTIFR